MWAPSSGLWVQCTSQIIILIVFYIAGGIVGFEQLGVFTSNRAQECTLIKKQHVLETS